MQLKPRTCFMVIIGNNIKDFEMNKMKKNLRQIKKKRNIENIRNTKEKNIYIYIYI